MQLASPRTRARADLQNRYAILNSLAESLGYERLIGRLIGGHTRKDAVERLFFLDALQTTDASLVGSCQALRLLLYSAPENDLTRFWRCTHHLSVCASSILKRLVS